MRRRGSFVTFHLPGGRAAGRDAICPARFYVEMGRILRSLTNLSVSEFLESAGAGTPTPGGGAVVAVAGALCASMLEMPLRFTAGKRRFADVEKRARELIGEVVCARESFEQLVSRDAQGYAAVAEALRMPRESDEERSARREAINEAMLGALEPPLEMVRLCLRLSRVAGEVLEIGNPNLSGDTAVAASLLPGAARAAALNVRQNLSACGEDRRRELSKELADSLAEIRRECERVAGQVEEKL